MTPVNEALNTVNLVFVLFEVWGVLSALEQTLVDLPKPRGS